MLRVPPSRKKAFTTRLRCAGNASQMTNSLPRNMSQQMLQESHNGWPFERFLLSHGVQFSLRRDGTHHRRVVPETIAQFRCLSTRRIGAHRSRKQVEAGFVYEDQRSSFSSGLFLSSGKVSACQPAISSSSRWSARSLGSCRVQPILCSNRPTCLSLDDTPNSCLMTAPTRARVQPSLRKPYDSAPRSRHLHMIDL